jgi:uncharacterized membrane protein YoaK (UPF0700 family)
MRRIGSAAVIAITFVTTALFSAGPAAADTFAPQPVDTTEQGAFGFVLMALMCGLIVGALFYMDRIRERRSRD